ncbi:MAG: Ig-like domain-containing protein [Gammaproteobacteria bacterium]|nr:Ig-like domain-containing protein [Gammaproteobacteria bacterium]
MYKRALALIVAVLGSAVILTACVKGSDSTAPSPNPNSGFFARFSPLVGVLPFPNDLYFNGSTTGTLNIPALDPTSPANAPTLAMNHLDGFGTQATINAYFSSAVDPTSLNAADVLVFKVTANPQTKAINPLAGATPLVAGTDYSVGLSSSSDSGGTVLNITPLKPLAGGSTYLVILTNGIKDTSGNPAAPSADFAAIVLADEPALAAGGNLSKIGPLPNAGLLPVAQFTLPQLAVASGAGLNLQNLVLTFSFSTQYIGASLAAVEANVQAGTGTLLDTGKNTKTATGGAALGLAEVYAGTLKIPYYLSVPTAANPTAPLTDSWHNSVNGGDTTVLTPMPAATTKVTIPMLATIPITGATGGCPSAKPSTGWKVVIFQHGIGQDRENVLAVADALAKACIAAVAIDLPLHGVTNTSDPLYQNQVFAGTAAASLVTGERTFNLDVVNNTTNLPGPDGQIDPSGASFINLQSLITSRDNLREGVADLIALRATIPSITVFGTASTLFDGSQISYVGHSLGAIVGTTFLAVDPNVHAATLGMPGGDISTLLQNSVTFAPIINAGLQSEGVVQGTQFYDDFFRDAQAVVDDGDPANYAALAAANHPIHMIEVIGGFGGDPCNVPDTVVPNANTELLAKLMGLTSVNSTTSGASVHAIVHFTAGTHGSLLLPTPPPNCSADAALYGGVFLEMQTEMATFIGSNGTFLPINNSPPGLIQ